jgi:hypothetical protein
MCSRQTGAVRATHTALEGTFVVTGTAGGVVLAPPLPTEITSPTRRSTSSTPLPTTLIVAPTSSTLSTRTRATSTSTERETTTSSSRFTSTPEPSGNDPAAGASGGPEEGFGTRQVIGLSVGIAGAVGLLLAAFLLARCRRRKRLDNTSPAIEPPTEKRASRGYWAGRDQRDIVHISPPLPGLSPAFPRPAESRNTIWPNTIGMALSRPQSGSHSAISSPHYRRASKLLPPKPYASRPYLTLNIPDPRLSVSPPGVSQPATPTRAAPPQIKVQTKTNGPLIGQLSKRPPPLADGRESAMTEFEEDGITSASVASRSASQVWRPPPSDPRSATTYYVADRSGNWVLGRPEMENRRSNIAELDASTPVKATLPSVNAARLSQAGIGHGKGSPIAPPAAQGPERPPAVNLLPAVNILAAAGKAMSAAPSVYSEDRTRKAVPAATAHNVPAMSFSHPEPPRRRSNSLTGRKSHNRSESQDGLLARQDSKKSHGSNNSVSTICSYNGGDEEGGRILDPMSLSPVVESPEAIGQGLGLSNNGRLMFRPPPVRLGLHSPPGQPSPTLGMLQASGNMPRAPAQMASEGAPLRYAPTGRQPQIAVPRRPDPAQFTTGSPAMPTMRIVPQPHDNAIPSAYPSPLRPQRPPLQRDGGQHQQQQQQYPHPRQPARTYPAPEQQRPPAAAYGQYMPYRPQAVGIHQALWGQGPVPGQDGRQGQQEHGWRPQPQPRRTEGEVNMLQQQLRRPDLQQATGGPYPQHIAQQQQQQQQQYARPSMAPSAYSNGSGSGSGSWSSSSSSLAAKRLGNERAATLAVQTTGGGSRHGTDPRWKPAQGEVLLLPQTPGWQPRLTPTRRGDDLFLNVQ